MSIDNNNKNNGSKHGTNKLVSFSCNKIKKKEKGKGKDKAQDPKKRLNKLTFQFNALFVLELFSPIRCVVIFKKNMIRSWPCLMKGRILHRILMKIFGEE